MLVAQSCDPKDCSLPGSSVHGILQGTILEWIAIPFSRGSSQSRDRTWVSCIAGRFFTIWATKSTVLQFLKKWVANTQRIVFCWWPHLVKQLAYQCHRNKHIFLLLSVQSLSHVRPYDPVDCSTPDLPVHHQLPEVTQTHAHWVGDAIQPSHPLSSPSPPALNLSQHQGLSQGVSSSHQVAKVLEFRFSISIYKEY